MHGLRGKTCPIRVRKGETCFGEGGEAGWVRLG